MAKPIIIKSNIQLFDWQRNVLDSLKEYNTGYIHVVKSKRQVGKSTLIEVLLLKAAIENNRSVSIFLSPTLEQARKVYKSIKELLTAGGNKLFERNNDLQLMLKLSNNSEIYFKSAEQKDALRGYTVTGIYCVDEAAYINDDIFYDTLAWCNVSQAPIVIVSTPLHKTGFFYKYFHLGLDDNNKVISYDWSKYDTSVLLPPEKLEQYRKELPKNKFKTEFLGEFLDADGGVFGDFSGVLSNDFEVGCNCYMGIDWGSGTGNDETAICVFNNKRQMIGLHHFSDKDETQTITYIIELIKQYKPLKVQVEMNSIGAIFYGLLDKAIRSEHLPVALIKFITTNDSKERLINAVQVAIQNKDIQLLSDNCLQVELDMYEMKVTNNGHSGYHDDCVIAMLLAFDCIKKGTYCIR
jgi:hypothetical protein